MLMVALKFRVGPVDVRGAGREASLVEVLLDIVGLVFERIDF